MKFEITRDKTGKTFNLKFINDEQVNLTLSEEDFFRLQEQCNQETRQVPLESPNKKNYPNYGILVFGPEKLTNKEIEEIMAADWFEPDNRRNLIMLDCSQLSDGLSILMESPSDCGISPHQDYNPINNCLKRWSKEDGFYHA